jgi:hypothetical protein
MIHTVMVLAGGVLADGYLLLAVAGAWPGITMMMIFGLCTHLYSGYHDVYSGRHARCCDSDLRQARVTRMVTKHHDPDILFCGCYHKL